MAAGVGSAVAVALLLYQGEGLLGALGVLTGLALASFGAGVWANAGEANAVPRRGRWTLVLLAFAVAATFAAFWTHGGGERLGAVGLPVGALLLLATPAYAAALVIARLAASGRGPAGWAIAGAGAGVALAGGVLIPKLDAESVLVGCAALIAIAAAFDPHAPPRSERRFMTGRVVLVTGVGGAGQLGYALAEAFLTAGAAVAVADLNGEVETLASALGAGVLGIPANLAEGDECARVVAAVRARFGHLDTLVNAAGGLSVLKPIADTSVDEWEREMKRNARTALLVTRAALPLLRESRGSVVNLASPAVSTPVAGLGAYTAAKAALVALTRTLAIEEKEHGVRVNAVAPGMVDTEQNRQSQASAAPMIPRKDVAAVVLFLASDAARAVSGEVVHVTGEAMQ